MSIMTSTYLSLNKNYNILLQYYNLYKSDTIPKEVIISKIVALNGNEFSNYDNLLSICCACNNSDLAYFIIREIFDYEWDRNIILNLIERIYFNGAMKKKQNGEQLIEYLDYFKQAKTSMNEREFEMILTLNENKYIKFDDDVRVNLLGLATILHQWSTVKTILGTNIDTNKVAICKNKVQSFEECALNIKNNHNVPIYERMEIESLLEKSKQKRK